MQAGERFTFEQLMGAERRNEYGQSNGRLLEAFVGLVLTTVEPFASQCKHVRYTPPNTPGCDLYSYHHAFERADHEVKDHFTKRLLLDQVRGIASRPAGRKFLWTSAWTLSVEAGKLAEQEGITVYTRSEFERWGEEMGGYPAREAIMGWRQEPLRRDADPLMPHQEWLASRLEKQLATSYRALLQAPCQTGKSYTLAAALRKMNAERVGYCIPTKALKDKALEDLIVQLNIPNLRVIVVGSEPGRDGVSKHIEDQSVLTAELAEPGPALVVYITKSAHKVRAAVEATSLLDANVVDEIHEMVGREKLAWAALNVPAEHLIGATATAVEVDDAGKATCAANGWRYFTLEDWPVVELSVAEARKRGLAVPARIVLSEVKGDEVTDWVAESKALEVLIETDEARGWDAAVALSIARGIHDTGTLKTMFSFNSGQSARTMLKLLPLACEWLGLPRLTGYYIDGDVPQATRNHTLWEFEHNPNPSFLVQMRTVDRGLAVGGLTGVAFCDPRHTWYSIMQFVGRAAGQGFKAHLDRKTHYNIFLPVFVQSGQDWTEAVEATGFASIVRAIADYNDDDAYRIVGDVQIVGRTRPGIGPGGFGPGSDSVASVLPETLMALKALVINDLRPITEEEKDKFVTELVSMVKP